MAKAPLEKLRIGGETMKDKETKLPLTPPSVLGFPPTMPIVTDPNGAYTGRPLNREEVPVQDVDDL